ELEGRLGGDEPTASALAAGRRARTTATTHEDSLASAVTEVRLLLKLGRFSEAEELATAVLAHETNPDPSTAGRLAGIAALVGRVHRSADFAAIAARMDPFSPDPAFRSLPVTIIETWQRLSAYAAIGA